MQFSKLSFAQALVAGLMVTSAAAAPLHLSDDFSGLEARDPSKIGRFFKKVGKTLKNEGQIMKTSLQMAAGAVGLTERDLLEARDFVDTLEARDFVDTLEARDFVDTLEARDVDTLEARDPSKIGRFFKKVGKTLKKEGQIMKNSLQMAAGAVGLTERDLLEARDFVDTLEARDVDTLEARDLLEARDPSKIGRFFKKVGKTLKKEGQVMKNSLQMAAGAVGLTSRDLEARDIIDTLEARDLLEARDPSKIGRFFKKVGKTLKNEGQIMKTSLQMAAGAVGLTERDIEARDFDEHWE